MTYFISFVARTPSAIRFAAAVALLHGNVKALGQLQRGTHTLGMLLKDASVEQMLAVTGLES